LTSLPAGVADGKSIPAADLLGRGAPPPRVVYGFLDLGDGGAQRLTLATLRHLDRERFAPAIVCARGGGALVPRARADGVEVLELGRLARPFDLGAVAAIAAALAGLGARILHVQLYSRSSPYFRAAARRAGTPVVVAHEWSRPSRPGRARRLADRLLRPGTRFLATSAAQRRELIEAGVRGSEIEVLLSGIELAPFGDIAREAARAELGLEPGRPIVLVPARLQPVKGHADLIALLPALRERVPDLLVLCAGTGPLAAELPGRAESAGVAEMVRFLGHRGDIPRLMAAADLVALPSRAEGVPSALLEAMAARRAVVATAVGGVAEAVADGVEGRLVAAGDGAGFAAALAELLLDPARAAAMGERGRARVAAGFRVEATARRLEELYARWLGRP
jgi:glycosyltransferase involved in cell wall biosynthesis